MRQAMVGVDPYERQHEKVDSLLRQWAKSPPEEWVIVAGSTGKMSTTRRLIQAVCQLSRGAVVFPGLTLMSQEELLEITSPTHPQYNLARLLKELEITSEVVKSWGLSSQRSAREGLLRASFRDIITPFGDLGKVF